MTDMTQIKRIQIQGSAPGVDQATAAIGKLADAQEKVAASGAKVTTSTTSSEKSVLRVAGAFERMRLSLDPIARDLDRFTVAQKLADKALRQGATNAALHAHTLEFLRDKYNIAADGTHKHSTELGLNRVQMMESIHVVKSLADSIIAGQSPLRAFAVEGGRIGQIFSEGNGSVGSQLKGLASQIGGLAGSFGPAILGFGGLGLAVVGGIASWGMYVEAVEKAKTSVAGVGAFAGVSGEQLIRLADQFATAGRISDGAARGMAGEFAVTGKIGADMFRGLITVAKDYAATTGTDITKAGADLAKAFADPAKGAEELNEKLGFLDGNTLHYIETLSAQNDRAAAQAALLEAMKPSLDDAASHVTSFGYAWDYVTNSARNAFDAIGAAIDRAAGVQSIADKIKLLEQQRDDNTRTAMFGEAPSGPTRDQQDSISDLQRNQAALDRMAADKAREIEANRLSVQATQDTHSTIPGYDQFEALTNKLVRLQKDLDDPLVKSKTNLHDLQEAIERTTNALKGMTSGTGDHRTYLTPALRQAEIVKATGQSYLDKKDPTKYAADQAKIEDLKLAGQQLTNAERSALIAANAQKGFDRSSSRSSTDSFEKSTIPSFEKGTAELQLQTGHIGKDPNVLAKEKAILDLTAAAKKDYGVVTDSVSAKIQNEANQRVAALQGLEEMKDKYAALQSAEKFAADAGYSVFEGMIKGGKEAEKALQGVFQMLEKALLQSAILGSGPLAGLFGTQAAVPGQVGGLFGSLFGNTLKGLSFSGAHADGGTIRPDQFGLVGERGPELALGGTAGKTIVPFAKLPQMTGGGGGPVSVTIHHSMDLTGANGDAAINAAAMESGRQAVQVAVAQVRQLLPGWNLDLQQRGG